MKHISLFSGIGGFDLAATWAGWENIVSCEINPFSQQILKYYWPNTYHHDDIKTLTYEKITQQLGESWKSDTITLSGGFPCQPFSLSGKRRGTTDERHLWPEMLRVIREVRPQWVVGENVFGLVNWNGGLVFEQVQIDLENEGYEVQPYILPACAVNAPHRRDRVWIVAYTAGDRETPNGYSTPTETNGQAIVLPEDKRRESEAIQSIRLCSVQGTRSSREMRNKCLYCQRDTDKTEFDKFWDTCPSNGHWLCAKSNTTIAEPCDVPNTTQFHKSNWSNFPTESPVCSRNDGISSQLDGITFSKWRNESVKAYGNAIVPQVAYEIFKAINFFELNKHNMVNL